MISIKDIAQRAGVSEATVGRALRDLPNVVIETRQHGEAVVAPRTVGPRATDLHRTNDRLGHPAPSA